MMRRLTKIPILLYLLATTLCSPSIGGDTLTPHQTLADDGGTLISAGGNFELGFFSPVGSKSRYIGIWYHKISLQTVVWVANRRLPSTGGLATLSITPNGTLVITNKNSNAVWSSESSVLANPVAQLLDSGNFVVRESGSDSNDPNSYAWQSFDFPTDTLLPGMKLGWNLTTGLNRNLTAWTSLSDPTPSNYTAGIDLHGDPQLLIWYGTKPYWRGGPWNGLYFSGIPAKSYKIFHLEFVIDSHQIVYLFYYLRSNSIISRLVMDYSGILHRLVWMEETKSWNFMWFAPEEQCDSVSQCGPYGACYTDDTPICQCLEGFRPRNPTNWDLRGGYSDGCVRTTALDCQNGTDGFFQLSNAKLPDTSRSMVDRSLSLEQCRTLCFKNCSCTAYASANISGSGSGCIIWSTDLTDITVYSSGEGQDLYVRLAAADLGSRSSHSHWSIIVAITVATTLAILLLACVACCVWTRKKGSSTHTSFSTERHVDEAVEGKDLELPLYDLGTITETTDNFSNDNKLGEGGFGPVYKGKLGQEQEIAVKRLSKTSFQGLNEFKNEVTLIAKLQHRNLVRLLGCCIEGGERMLIYEYMHNGSLDAFLFDKAKGALLDWQTRYNIIMGIARGLLYIHQDSTFKIIHRDLKASNILLDKNMDPKISDFGMARIFGGDQTEANTRRVVGTYGYMPPEYIINGIFSVKSDVFSFGVLVLEIVTGKKNRGFYDSQHHLNLLGYIWSLWNEGRGSELVDKSIDYSFPIVEALRCINIGLLCVQERPEDRPTMSTVLLMLSSDSELPRPRQPGFLVLRSTVETDLSMSNQELLSANIVSITMLEGR